MLEALGSFNWQKVDEPKKHSSRPQSVPAKRMAVACHQIEGMLSQTVRGKKADLRGSPNVREVSLIDFIVKW